MEAGTGTGVIEKAEAPVPRLTPWEFWFCIAVAVTMFLFITGPVWTHPWEIDVLDTAIYVSYIPIPFLAIALLARRRALTARGAFLDILKLTLLKYSITFSFALVLWAIATPPPPLAAAPSARLQNAALEIVPPPSVIAPEQTGVLEGAAVDSEGRPLAEALIFIESGLEAYVFAPPKKPLELENTGAGITPRIAAAMVRQPILARSTDGHLHTFVASSGGAAMLNVPLLSSGSWTPITVRNPGPIATLVCSVHQRSGKEWPAHLAVFAHPFFAITGPDGRFRFEGVPAGSLRVGGWHRERGTVSQEARLEARAALDVPMKFGPRQAAEPGQAP